MDTQLNVAKKFYNSILTTGAVIAGNVLKLMLVVLTFTSMPAWAQIDVGDILAVSPTAGIVNASAVVRVNPLTGTQTLIASGFPMQVSVGIVLESDGFILVTDRSLPGVIRIDPSTGTKTILHSGSPFVDPFGIAKEANGNILVSDVGYAPGGAVIRVNPLNGSTTVLTSGGFLDSPYGIEVEAAGTIVVSDATSSIPPFTGAGGIIRVNPTTGTQSAVSVGSSANVPNTFTWGCPFGITVEESGTILTSLFNPPGFGCQPPSIWRAEPVSPGVQTFVSTNPPYGWEEPFGMAIETDNNIIVAEEGLEGIFRITPVPEALPMKVSDGGYLDGPGSDTGPTDVAISLPAPPPPPELPPTASTPGKATGGGDFDPVTGDAITDTQILIVKGSTNSGKGGFATFGFNVKFSAGGAAPTGNLTFHDHDANITIMSTSYTLLLITGTHAQFKGICTFNGVPGKHFTVDVDDLGSSGSDLDTFSIQVEDGPYFAKGVLLGGNITVH